MNVKSRSTHQTEAYVADKSNLRKTRESNVSPASPERTAREHRISEEGVARELPDTDECRVTELPPGLRRIKNPRRHAVAAVISSQETSFP